MNLIIREMLFSPKSSSLDYKEEQKQMPRGIFQDFLKKELTHHGLLC
jgi:hypothetical protein